MRAPTPARCVSCSGRARSTRVTWWPVAASASHSAREAARSIVDAPASTPRTSYPSPSSAAFSAATFEVWMRIWKRGSSPALCAARPGTTRIDGHHEHHDGERRSLHAIARRHHIRCHPRAPAASFQSCNPSAKTRLHSARNVIAGSTQAARHAGIHRAIADTPASRATTPGCATGSSLDTPNSNVTTRAYLTDSVIAGRRCSASDPIGTCGALHRLG